MDEMEKGGNKMQRTRKQGKKKLILLMMLIAAVTVSAIAIGYRPEAATEKAVSSRSWEDVETVIRQKLGTGYSEAGMCTGYLYWCLKNAYGVDWGTNSPVSDLEDKIVEKGITKVAEGTDGRITADMKPGDIVIFIDGSYRTHCAILGEGGRLYHARSSTGVSDSPTLAKWMELPDASKNCDRYRVYRGLVSDIDITVSVSKQSGDVKLTDGNDCYSLAGAQYEASCGGVSITLTTDENGKASGVLTSVPLSEAGKVAVREIKPSAGYALDGKVYTENGLSGKVTVVSDEPPVRNPVDVLLRKYDSETEKAQKGASLQGAVFRVDFYGTESEDTAGGDDADPLRTWYFETDESGEVHLDESCLADGYTQSELYYDTEEREQAVLPLGAAVIGEVKASEGYLLNEEVYSCRITGDGSSVLTEVYNAPDVPEQIKRGDISFCKIEGETQHRMAYIPFMITSLDDEDRHTGGESHIVVTDANGYVSTSDSFNRHSADTNGNDDAWDGKTADAGALDPSAGVWFGDEASLDCGKGALPYGRYVIDELPCSMNEGFTLLKGIEIEVTRDNYVIELGTLTNSRMELATSVCDKMTKQTGVTYARENTVLTDRVEYSGLEPGEEYYLKGTLMDKSEGKPVVSEGKEVTGETVFTPDSADGAVYVDFEFDSRDLDSRETVVFETLYKDGLAVAKHEDISDEGQTIGFLNPLVYAEHSVTESPATGDRVSVVIFAALILMAAACVVMLKLLSRKA